ncbi:MAG: DSD1 family PLP-dependent enzyme [Alphaproteobacteria bacterium]|nr:DSD1 family PLP-dependent enzyme [Alphaproteobacteria bacterium]MBU1547989.1 DSD1 family PLP-dependent enzyme [Alphaproteobacteria bacterium]MBU2336249.1 DSD1 family PLP-dependent enzyme [Alphaproteobacteria bacterium]MBU2390356.1 DSD1 family PLP-dependent enzyme [Alphaproteobacteria bacterium]
MTVQSFVQYDLHAPGSRYALNTPALVLDLDAFERNVSRMADIMHAHGKNLRPHAKSHKSPTIARAQIAAGAVGCCCATLDEAEVMAAAGIAGILITSPVTTALKLDRLIALAGKAPDTMIVVDNPANAEALAARASAAGVRLNVIIDVELGFGRTGVTSPEAAVALGQTIKSLPSLAYQGLQAYGGHIQHTIDPDERLALCRQAHLKIDAVILALSAIDMKPGIVTGGGTGSHAIDAREGPFTEIQAGSYIFMDAEYETVIYESGKAWPFENALFVQTAVISANVAGFVTTDAGTKAFALNGPAPRVISAGYETATYSYAGDEHGRLHLKNGAVRPVIGDVIECVVSHNDPTVALYGHYHCVRADRLVALWDVSARR